MEDANKCAAVDAFNVSHQDKLLHGGIGIEFRIRVTDILDPVVKTLNCFVHL